MKKEHYYLLALNRIEGVGSVTIQKLLQEWEDPADIFKQSSSLLISFGIKEHIANQIARFDFSVLEQDLAWENSSSQHFFIAVNDKNYPKLLKEIYDPPMILYVKGSLSCLHKQALAIVGTRKPSPAGREIARQFSYDIALHDITIVSGMALGIDAAAHLGAIAAKGSTVAVLGTGINQIYPRIHAQLSHEIAHYGCLISEFPLNKSANAGHFPQRNRIISGLSLITLIVEAAIKSGSLITAKFALEQNRDVLAIPSSIKNPQARGCHHLLQQGAKLVTCSDEVLAELPNRDQKTKEKSRLKLANQHKNLVKCIGFEATSLDQIVHRSGLSLDKVATELIDLELQGIVHCVPGGYLRID